MAAIGRVWFTARKYPLPAELLLLAAIVAQARDDAKRGSIEAREWLRLAGFEV